MTAWLPGSSATNCSSPQTSACTIASSERASRSRSSSAWTRRSASWRTTSTCSRPRGGGRRGVLELLLGAEQRIQHLLAQTLGQRERSARTDDQEEDPPAPALLLLGLRAAQRVGRVAEGGRGLLELLLGLLVVEQGLRGPLPVRHPLVGLARRLVRRAKVLAQLVVLYEPLHVGVGPGGLAGRYRAGAGLRGLLLLRCHGSPRIRSLRETYPDRASGNARAPTCGQDRRSRA